jgi:hypothetical protein
MNRTVMRRPRYRLLFDWGGFEAALREAAARRGWSATKIDAALARDKLCTIDVDDVESHLDWHERQGFLPTRVGVSEG